MKKLLTSATKGPRRKLALGLAVALVAISTSVVYAAKAAPDFSLSSSPSSQTAAQGLTVSYTISVTRMNGFTGSVALSASNLPSGVTAQFSPSNTISSTSQSTTVKLKVASTTPPGTYSPVIKGTSGSLSHTTTLGLVVQSASIPDFTVAATPSSQTISQGDQTTYSVAVTRTGGFSGSIDLSVSGAPSGTVVSWQPGSTVASTATSATLALDTPSDVSPNTYTLTVTGSGAINGVSTSRTTTMTLVVQKKVGVTISGNLSTPLNPGTSTPLDLVLTNPNNFSLNINSLAVAIRGGTSATGCSGTSNFSAKQIPATRYPIALPAGATMSLSQLGVADRDKPALSMVDQPWNQDVCKGATVYLDYNASATR